MKIVNLSDLKNEKAGGKASSLAKLMQLGHMVPGGFVLLPGEVMDRRDLLASVDTLDSERFAVRSSAVNEDGKHAAWAGQLETKLNVERDGLIETIKLCRKSAESARAQAYAKARGEESGDVAVIVQRMLDSAVSGVAFSEHPVTGQDATVIEAVYGFGEQLVSGLVTPDTYVITEPFVISEQHLAGDEPILNTKQLEEVTMLTRTIAEQFGFPVDIEWSYEQDTLYVLQARPITT